MTIFCIILMAVIVLVALLRKNSVKFHVRLWGARVHLEARGNAGNSANARPPARSVRLAARGGEEMNRVQ
jgi:hypothetical protein